MHFIENILNQDPHVLSSVMFGRGRFQAGALIDPRPQYKFDPSDTEELAEFRNKIWPTVERMNAFAPQHSRLFKEVCPLCIILSVFERHRGFFYCDPR